MTKSKTTTTGNEEGKKSSNKVTQTFTVVDIWRRSGRSSARNETDALLEALIEKTGLK